VGTEGGRRSGAVGDGVRGDGPRERVTDRTEGGRRIRDSRVDPADAARGTGGGREARGADLSQGSGGWEADSPETGKSRNKFLSPLRTF
jgi:hypothetical protein